MKLGRLLVLAIVLCALLAGACFAYVWPTRWRWDHVTVSGETYPVRIDRITGHADVLLPGDGWTPIEDAWRGDEEPPADGRS